jgi:hypothetical protein
LNAQKTEVYSCQGNFLGMWICIIPKNCEIFISFVRAVGNLHLGVCMERMSESVWCYLLSLRCESNAFIESTSVFICNKPALDEILRRKAKHNFAKCNKENRETTKKISVWNWSMFYPFKSRFHLHKNYVFLRPREHTAYYTFGPEMRIHV